MIFLKKNVCVCKIESLCCTAEARTTLYINFTSIKKKKETTAYWILVSIFPPNWEIFLNKTALNECILSNKKPSYFWNLYSSYRQDNPFYAFPLNRKENAICTRKCCRFSPSALSFLTYENAEMKRVPFTLPEMVPRHGKEKSGSFTA